MFKKKKLKKETPPYIKYTQYGFSYVDVDILFNHEDGKKLNERMNIVRKLSIYQVKSRKRNE